MSELQGRRILIFVGANYEDMELQYPKYRLLEAGAQVVLAGLSANTTYLGKHGYPQKTDAAVADLSDDASLAKLDGLVVPGGWMPDQLRRDEHVLKITKAVSDAGKCVASICHGPWIDISADIVKGVTYTSTPGIKDDLVNAGATWVDREVCVDGHHVTARRPGDLPAFMREMIKVLASQK